MHKKYYFNEANTVPIEAIVRYALTLGHEPSLILFHMLQELVSPCLFLNQSTSIFEITGCNIQSINFINIDKSWVMQQERL